MKVKVYIDWDDREILSEKEYKERIAKMVTDSDYRYYETDYLDDHIKNWLDEHHCAHTLATVFHMSEKEKEEVLEICHKEHKKAIERNFANFWDEIEIDI